MENKIICGNTLAQKLKNRLKTYVEELWVSCKIVPNLSIIRVGDDPASKVYVDNKIRAAQSIGMNATVHELAATASQDILLTKLDSLNEDPKVSGIIVQLPLPDHINEFDVIDTIEIDKDVDGLSTYNIGRLVAADSYMVPCTAYGAVLLIKDTIGKDLSGKHAVVLGRSNIVGKPTAHLLLQENCTVTIAHSHTKNLAEICQNADILISAVGKKHIITSDMVKEGAIVIDVGINVLSVDDNGKRKLTGDVDFDNVVDKVQAITPVPGGVGPMTVACLLSNTIQACCIQRNIEGFNEIIEEILELK